MKRTLLLESLRGETRLAVIEENRLCEMYVERPDSDEGAGSVYLGRVENVLPGMNAAFVDIGMEKNGFLSAEDIPPEVRGDRALAERLRGLRVEALMKPGDSVLVQVIKPQSGQKGHRVSCYIGLPGRLIVLLPQVIHAGVSRRIAEPEERERLQAIGQALVREYGMGAIIRTAASCADAEALRAEYAALSALWGDIQRRSAHDVPPRKLFSANDLLRRCAGELLDADTDAVWVDGPALYEALMAQVQALAPGCADKVRLHEGQIPLFDIHKVDRQLDRALRRYVWLDSGGSLVIQQTEAMTVIDVNTGKFTGKRDLDETLFTLNCEAAAEIVRQLRLRDIGGIVIVDFIDMSKPAHNEALLARLRELARADRNRLTVVGMTGLGLVELTRKRQRRPLSQQLLHICSHCGGDGMSPSHETTARRAVRDVWRRRRMEDASPLLVAAAPPVAGWIRKIGAPEGGETWVCPDPALEPGDYRISPVGVDELPPDSKRLK